MKTLRRGFSLLEGVLALSLASSLLALVWLNWRQGRMQSERIEEDAELTQAACLVHESLTWDLMRSLPPGLLEAKASDPSRLVLPFFSGYQGEASQALRYQPVTYQFDPESKTLTRNQKPLLVGVVDSVRFRWERGSLTMLVVELGRTRAQGKDAEFRLRLPAFTAESSRRHWLRAAHHLGGEEGVIPELDPRGP